MTSQFAYSNLEINQHCQMAAISFDIQYKHIGLSNFPYINYMNNSKYNTHGVSVELYTVYQYIFFQEIILLSKKSSQRCIKISQKPTRNLLFPQTPFFPYRRVYTRGKISTRLVPNCSLLHHSTNEVVTKNIFISETFSRKRFYGQTNVLKFAIYFQFQLHLDH